MIRLFTVSEGTLTEVGGSTARISQDGTQLAITATVAEGSTVRAVLASSYNLSEGEIYLQSGQSPTASSFYQNGDVLISDDEVVTPGDDVPLSIKVYTNLNVYEKDLSGTVSFKLGRACVCASPDRVI